MQKNFELSYKWKKIDKDGNVYENIVCHKILRLLDIATKVQIGYQITQGYTSSDLEVQKIDGESYFGEWTMVEKK